MFGYIAMGKWSELQGNKPTKWDERSAAQACVITLPDNICAGAYWRGRRQPGSAEFYPQGAAQ